MIGKGQRFWIQGGISEQAICAAAQFRIEIIVVSTAECISKFH